MGWKTLEAHPAADQFPLMCGIDLKNLAGNIRAKGQVFPIILTNEEMPRILDGRNRLAAYRLLEAQGVIKAPWIETYRGELSPEDYVQSVNWERMHLNGTQRAALAVLMKEGPFVGAQLKEEAKKRQGKRNDLTSASAEAKVKPNGRVSDLVAEKMNVSGAEVERADRIRKENPEGFQKLKDGASTVRAEYSKLPKKQRTQETILSDDDIRRRFREKAEKELGKLMLKVDQAIGDLQIPLVNGKGDAASNDLLALKLWEQPIAYEGIVDGLQDSAQGLQQCIAVVGGQRVTAPADQSIAVDNLEITPPAAQATAEMGAE